MTSREIVQATLDYASPERLARSFPDSDFIGTGHTAKTHATDWKEVGNGRWERSDEWGNLWARVDTTSKGEVVKGVLNDINDIALYKFPDFSDPASYDNVRKDRASAPDKWLIGWLPGFTFNIANKLRKLENYLMDLLLEPEQCRLMHDRIDRCLEDMIRGYANAGVDAIMFPEDWGTQKQTLISPALWREEFFPRFQKLCGLAHSLGLKVFMHSCGRIEAIVPGLIEAGVDVLQFDQPELHGLEKLAEHQRGRKITFWCPVDIQRVLQTRDESVIRQRARDMVNILWRGQGGFIAGHYSDNTSIGLEPRWQEYANEEFLKRGIRKPYL
ncbi:MAG: uroporphyrinogen decarboxylase family protein [Fibrobacterota bacterium]